MTRRVVVTGMGAITPIGNNVQDFYSSLVNGVCGIDFIKGCDTSNLKVKIGAEIKNYDATSLLSVAELKKTDLYTVYALQAAKEAVENSGIIDNVDPTRLGVYVGSGIGGFSTMINENNKLNTLGPKRVSPYMIPMMISNTASGTIAINYNAQGVCLPIVSACATGSNSIGEAYRAIKDGYADAIITGGAEASINPLAISGFTSIMALTLRNDPLNACIPFDKRRDGFVMGEGAGVLILEEYTNAIKRKAKIYAEIIGYGSTCDAYHITAPEPSGKGAARAIKLAMENVKDTDSLYINAHGTSTPYNDREETSAIKLALTEKRARDAYISSTKSMTGHCLGAAGAIEAIATIKALSEGILPPTIGYLEKDSDCDLYYIPNTAINKKVDVGLSTSFGFGGHNACLAFKLIS